MHVDELDIDESLVRRLLEGQFPEWRALPIEPVPSAGTDNAMYRLGDDMAVRLPRYAAATLGIDKEHEWLPKLAPHLPVDVPLPLAKGAPGEGYPWHWSVCRWLEGETVTRDRVADPRDMATDVARFIAALHRIDSAGGPPPGPHNFGRGVPLAERDAATRTAIASLQETIDSGAALAAWEAALHAPAWDGPPVWIHGDLTPGNLLARRGRLSGVLDFGGLAVGDPACDLIVAWNLLSADTRKVLRAALSVDDATWERGRGWALSVAVIYIPYYASTSPAGVADARRVVDAVLADREIASSARM